MEQRIPSKCGRQKVYKAIQKTWLLLGRKNLPQSVSSNFRFKLDVLDSAYSFNETTLTLRKALELHGIRDRFSKMIRRC